MFTNANVHTCKGVHKYNAQYYVHEYYICSLMQIVHKYKMCSWMHSMFMNAKCVNKQQVQNMFKTLILMKIHSHMQNNTTTNSVQSVSTHACDHSVIVHPQSYIASWIRHIYVGLEVCCVTSVCVWFQLRMHNGTKVWT